MKYIRKILDRLQLTHTYFNMRRRSYFKKHSISITSSGADSNLKELSVGGAVVLHEFHPEYVIKNIRAKALEICWKLKQDGESSFPDTVIYDSDGIYRLKGDICKYVPEISILLEQEYIKNLVRSYAREYININKQTCYLDFKPDVGKHDYTTVPHMDSWLSSIKIFTLLSDVGPKNAPFVYWRGSHLDWPWRRELDYANYLGTEIGSYGNCPSGLLSSRSGPGNPLQEIEVCGKAGTVIVVDTRTFHRASNLYEGYRLQLVQKFPAQFTKRMRDIILGG